MNTRQDVLAAGHTDLSLICATGGQSCNQVGIATVPIASIMGWVDPNVLAN